MTILRNDTVIRLQLCLSEVLRRQKFVIMCLRRHPKRYRDSFIEGQVVFIIINLISHSIIRKMLTYLQRRNGFIRLMLSFLLEIT